MSPRSPARGGSNVDLRKDADFLLTDPNHWLPLARTLERGICSDDERIAAEQTLFALWMGLGESAITGVYVPGRKVAASPLR